MPDDKPDLSALWPLLPPWIKWVAMDHNGRWHAFEKKPTSTASVFGYWSSWSEYSYMLIPKKYAPHWRGGWEKSLTRRPK